MKYMQDINNRDLPYSWMRRLNVLPNESIQEMQFGLQHGVSTNQQVVLLELEELLFKFIWKNKEPSISKMIFKMMKKGGVILSHIVIKTTWYGVGIDKKTTGEKIRHLETCQCTYTEGYHIIKLVFF